MRSLLLALAALLAISFAPPAAAQAPQASAELSRRAAELVPLHAVAGSWNNPAAAVEDARFVALITRAVQLVR